MRMLYNRPRTRAGEGGAGLDPVLILKFGILLFVNFFL